MSTLYLQDAVADTQPHGNVNVGGGTTLRQLFDNIRGNVSVAHVTPTKASATSIGELQAVSLFQGAVSTSLGGVATPSLGIATDAAIRSGETLVVYVQWALVFGGGGPDPTSVTVTDNAVSCGGKRNNIYRQVDPADVPYEVEDTSDWNGTQIFICENAVGTTSAPTVTATFNGVSPGFPYIGVVRLKPCYIETGVQMFGNVGSTSGTGANNATVPSLAAPGFDNAIYVAYWMNNATSTAPTVGTTVAWTSRTTTSGAGGTLVTMIETYDQPSSAALVASARFAVTGTHYTGLCLRLRPKSIAYASQIYAPGTNITGNMTATQQGLESSASANAGVGGILEAVDRFGVNLLATLKTEVAYPSTITEFTTTTAPKALAATAVTAYNPSVPFRFRDRLRIKNVGTMGGPFTVTTSVSGPTAAAAGDAIVTPPTTQTPWLDPAKPYFASSSSGASGTDTVAVAVPSGITSGALIIGYVTEFWPQNTTPAVSTDLTLPTGWHVASMTSWLDTVDNFYFATYVVYKWATASDTGTYSWSVGSVGGVPGGGTMVVTRRVVQCSAANGTNPFDSITFGTAAAAQTVSIASSTPSANNYLIDTWGMANTNKQMHAPDGVIPTYAFDFDAQLGGVRGICCKIEGDAAEATGTLVWTTDIGSNSWMTAVSAILLGTATPEIADHGPIFSGDQTSIVTAKVKVPGGVVSGSLVLVCVTATWLETSTAPTDVGWTLPSGFTSTGMYGSWTDTAFSSKEGMFWFYKYASATEDPNATYDFTTPNFGSAAGWIINAKAFRISGGPTSGNPCVDTFQFLGNVSTSLPLGTFTPGGANSLFVVCATATQPTTAATDHVWPTFPFFPIDRTDDSVQQVSTQYGFGSQLTAAATGTQTWDTVTAYTAAFVGIVTIRSGSSSIAATASASFGVSASGTGKAVATAGATFGISASGTASSSAAATATASFTFSAGVVTAAPATATAAIVISATAIDGARAVATATFGVSASGFAGYGTTGSASFGISASATSAAPDTATASFTISTSGTAKGVSTATASFAFTATGNAGFGTTGNASFTISASALAAALAVATAVFAISATGTAGYGASGSAAFTITATATSVGAATATASFTFTATGTPGSLATATASFAFVATAIAAYAILTGVTASFAISATGTAKGASTATATFTISASNTGTSSPATATASFAFTATAIAAYGILAGVTASFTVSTSATSSVPITSTASFVISATATPKAAATAAATFAFTATAIAAYAILTGITAAFAISASSTSSVPVTATASFVISASGTQYASPTASATFAFTMTGTPATLAIATAAFALIASAVFSTPASGTGSFTITASVLAAAAALASAAFTISATGTDKAAATATAAFAITASAVAAGIAAATATASFTFVATATAAYTILSGPSGSFSITAAGTNSVPGTASATFAFVATLIAKAVAAATASFAVSALSTSATPVTSTASFAVFASSSGKGVAISTATFSVSASGTAAGTQPATGTASFTITASGTARAASTALATITFTATAGAPVIPASASASFAVNATTTASVSSSASAAFAVSMTGAAAILSAATATASITFSMSAGAQLAASGSAVFHITVTVIASGSAHPVAVFFFQSYSGISPLTLKGLLTIGTITVDSPVLDLGSMVQVAPFVAGTPVTDYTVQIGTPTTDDPLNSLGTITQPARFQPGTPTTDDTYTIGNPENVGADTLIGTPHTTSA